MGIKMRMGRRIGSSTMKKKVRCPHVYMGRQGMIKNIVLDIGMVLGHFCWEKVYTDIMRINGEDFDRLAKVTVLSPYWDEFDKGILTDEEITRKCVELSPADEKLIREFYSHLGEVVVDFDYAYDWVKNLKAAGFKVYLLSNFGKTAFERCRANGNLAFVDLVDGDFISYRYKMIKPDPVIYETFLKTYNLSGEESLFIDDRQVNVQGAIDVGMQAYLFENYEKTVFYIEKLTGKKL